MQLFVGRHSWHNFSQDGVKPSAKLECAVDSLTCEGHTLENGERVAILSVCANHFVYHQIRRIVGMLLALRAGVSESYVELAFDTNVHNLPIPLAPAQPLYLQQGRYTGYARRHGLSSWLTDRKDEQTAQLGIMEWEWEQEVFLHCACGSSVKESLWSGWVQEMRERWVPRMLQRLKDLSVPSKSIE
jgi:hypothetical protein